MIGTVLRGAAALLLLGVAAATAAAPAGTMSIALHTDDGQRVVIGQANFRANGDAWNYTVTYDETRFVDKFLSMRPFRCLEHAGTVLCHLPYPYAKTRRITAEDLRDLEYDLLFLEKSPDEYGINPWNGRYFVLRFTAAGVEGILHEVDLNVLAAPPDAGVTHPITPAMLHPADPAAQPFPRLTIE